MFYGRQDYVGLNIIGSDKEIVGDRFVSLTTTHLPMSDHDHAHDSSKNLYSSVTWTTMIHQGLYDLVQHLRISCEVWDTEEMCHHCR